MAWVYGPDLTPNQQAEALLLVALKPNWQILYDRKDYEFWSPLLINDSGHQAKGANNRFLAAHQFWVANGEVEKRTPIPATDAQLCLHLLKTTGI